MNLDNVVVAEILRPRGNRGEVVARSQTDVPGRLESLKSAYTRLTDGSDTRVEITAAWPHKNEWVLKFEGVDSIDAAERFRGADLWVPPAERGALAPGEFFQSDLIGCQVVDTATGQAIGFVTGWQQHGGPPLMEVAADKRELLIPFLAPLCSVNLDERSIRVDVPEGLLDL